MSTPLLIEILTKMITIHQSLYDISVYKTEVIKKGDIDPLKSIIRDEQKHIAAMQLLEKQRHEIIKCFQTEMTIDLDVPTISELLNYINTPDKEEIQYLQEKLTSLITNVVESNELNQQLLIQSLQFINLNLDLLMPSSELSNYTLPSKEEDAPATRPIFDSQA